MKLLHHLFFSAIAIASLSSCMRSASMTVLQPAKFTVPEQIAKLAVIDRSKPSNGWLNVLEGVLTGEAIGQDRRSREEAVDGLTEGLRNTPRFQVIRTGIEMTGSKAGSNMPQPLPWSEIERICRENHADAVVAIESFDTDNNISTVRRESKAKNAKTGKETITVTYHSDMRTSVRMGWRMYDPQSKIIIDESNLTNKKVAGRAAYNVAVAAELSGNAILAQEWAKISWEKYGNKKAREYIYTLENRMNDQRKANQQMHKKA